MTAMPACLMEGWCERKIPCGFTRQTPCLARHSWWDNSIDEIRREHRRHTSTLTRKMCAEGNAARGRCKLRAMRRRPPAYDTTVAISCEPSLRPSYIGRHVSQDYPSDPTLCLQSCNLDSDISTRTLHRHRPLHRLRVCVPSSRDGLSLPGG
jgi:hypothetical protein